MTHVEGLLDGKKATSNNMAFEWAKSQSAKTHWVKHARWVEVWCYAFMHCLELQAEACHLLVEWANSDKAVKSSFCSLLISVSLVNFCWQSLLQSAVWDTCCRSCSPAGSLLLCAAGLWQAAAYCMLCMIAWSPEAHGIYPDCTYVAVSASLRLWPCLYIGVLRFWWLSWTICRHGMYSQAVSS